MLISVLIVDNDEEIRNVLSTILEGEGYSVETAENGKKAVQRCERRHFDVALIEIDLFDIIGIELLIRMKELQPKMVKIIITGDPSIEDATKSVNEKADGYVLKPFNVEMLLEMIKKLVMDKTNVFFQMFTDVEQAKESNTISKY